MKMMVAVFGCAALGVHAADDPQAPKILPELVVEMITITKLGPDGKQVGGRTRQTRTMLHDGKGATWSTLIGAEYTLQKGNDFWHLNPNAMSQVGRKREKPGDPIDVGPTRSSGTPIRSGVLGKKVEEGVTIAGEWNEYPMRDGGVERREIWWRGDTDAAGRPVLRIHHLVSTSPTRITRKDYWYIQTERIHPDYFDPNP
jgi:hypothetical protein